MPEGQPGLPTPYAGLLPLSSASHYFFLSSVLSDCISGQIYQTEDSCVPLEEYVLTGPSLVLECKQQQAVPALKSLAALLEALCTETCNSSKAVPGA